MAVNCDSAGSGRGVTHGSSAGIDDLPLADFTFPCIIRRTSNGNNQHLISKGIGWQVAIVNDLGGEGAMSAVANHSVTATETATAAGAIPLDTDLFVAVVWTLSTKKFIFYISALTTQTALSAFALGLDIAGSGTYVSDAASTLTLGNHHSATTNPFRGTISRGALIKRALTAAQLDVVKHAYIAGWDVANTELLFNYVDNTTLTNLAAATAGSHNGTLLASAPSAASPVGSQLMAVNNANFACADATWFSDGTGNVGASGTHSNATYIRSNRQGAWFRFPVTIASSSAGNVWGRFDSSSLSDLTTPATNGPAFIVIATKSDGDGGNIVSQTLGYNANLTNQRVLLRTGLPAGTWMIDVIFDAINEDADYEEHWTGPSQALKLWGIEADTTASVGTISRLTDYALWLSDSNSNGAALLAAGTTRASNSAYRSVPYMVSRALGVECSMHCVGGIGVTKGYHNQTASSTYPSMYSATDANKAWNKYYSGQDIDWTYKPKWVFISLGGNDVGDFSAALTSLINDVRTTLPDAYIFVFDHITSDASGSDAVNGYQVTAVANASSQAKLKKISCPSLYYADSALNIVSRFSNDSDVSQHLNQLGVGYQAAYLSAQSQAFASVDAVPIGRSTVAMRGTPY